MKVFIALTMSQDRVPPQLCMKRMKARCRSSFDVVPLASACRRQHAKPAATRDLAWFFTALRNFAPAVPARAQARCAAWHRTQGSALHESFHLSTKHCSIYVNSTISVIGYTAGSTWVTCTTASKASKRMSAATAASARSKVHLSCTSWSKDQLNAQISNIDSPLARLRMTSTAQQTRTTEQVVHEGTSCRNACCTFLYNTDVDIA